MIISICMTILIQSNSARTAAKTSVFMGFGGDWAKLNGS